MTFQNIKPINILWQDKTKKEALSIVNSAIVYVLYLAGVLQEYERLYLGNRGGSYHLMFSHTIRPDQHIEIARQKSIVPGSLSAVTLLNATKDDQTRRPELGYDLTVIKEPLHWSPESAMPIIGIARTGQGCVVTLSHILELLQPVIGESEEDRQERHSSFALNLRMLVIHEFGHVFDSDPDLNLPHNPTIEQMRASHCQNECVMRSGNSEELSHKIRHRPFCPDCLKKRRAFFRKP